MGTDTDTGLPEYVPTNFETFKSMEKDSDIVMDADPDKSAQKMIKLKKRKLRTVAENVASCSGPEEAEVRTVIVSFSCLRTLVLKWFRAQTFDREDWQGPHIEVGKMEPQCEGAECPATEAQDVSPEVDNLGQRGAPSVNSPEPEQSSEVCPAYIPGDNSLSDSMSASLAFRKKI
jgi:hypothetical protein